MNTEKLFDEGNYMVIYLQPETVMNHERQFFLWNLEEMATVTVSQIKNSFSCVMIGCGNVRNNYIK